MDYVCHSTDIDADVLRTSGKLLMTLKAQEILCYIVFIVYIVHYYCISWWRPL